MINFLSSFFGIVNIVNENSFTDIATTNQKISPHTIKAITINSMWKQQIW